MTFDTLRRIRLSSVVAIGCWLGSPSGLAVAQDDSAQVNKDRLIVETLLRLNGYDLDSNAAAKAAVLRHVRRQRGTVDYVKLMRHFTLKELAPTLVAIALKDAGTTSGAEAASLAVELGQLKAFSGLVEGKSAEKASQALAALGHVDRADVRGYLLPLVTRRQVTRTVRNAAARAVGRTRLGEKELLALARAGKITEDTKFAVGNILLASGDAKVAREAQEYFKLPAGANATPLPPIAQLVKLIGNPTAGRKSFETTASCAKCHKVRGTGKEVGPDLSEIGSKLSREALFVSILDPSAGISHNYETYLVELVTGNVLSGIMVSQTGEVVILKTKEAIEKTIKKADIELLQKTENSLMPADLVKTMTQDQLADIVEYLVTLKKEQ